jgi:thiamine pyrophosphate-dependent acetolactate synthase large subunit-like protein
VVRRHWEFSSYGQYLGGSGGGGLGYGPGATIGASLAKRGSDTLVVSHQSDGDLLYTASALWTAAHESLPLLMIVVNNRSYGQDRMHQLLMSSARDRPEAHARVGIDITAPDWDFAKLAEAQGVEGMGVVSSPTDLGLTLSRAASIVRNEQRPVLVDVLVP